MTQLSDEAVGRLALDALGGNKGRAAMAVAVAIAEHGGGPVESTVVSPTGDYGVWQINKAAHPSWSPTRLLSDPAYNAKAMKSISNNGSNWRPWAVCWEDPWESGFMGDGAPVAKFFDRGAAAVGGVPSTTNPGDYAVVNDVGAVLGAVADFLGLLTSWSTWRRLLYVLAGLVLIVAGGALLAGDLSGITQPTTEEPAHA